MSEAQQRIFVSYPVEVKDSDLKQYFNGFGSITEFYIPSDRSGMAIITFQDVLDKDVVLSSGPHIINGKTVVCEDAIDKPLDDVTEIGGPNSDIVLDNVNGQSKTNWTSGNCSPPPTSTECSNSIPSSSNRDFSNTTNFCNGSLSPDQNNNNNNLNVNNLGMSNTGNSSNSNAMSVTGTNLNDQVTNLNTNQQSNSQSLTTSQQAQLTVAQNLKKGGYTTSTMNEESNRVFVTRIGEEISKDDLEAYFCQFGELTDIFVPLKNPNSDVKDGQHKGIAFVSFKTKDTYDEVLSRDKYEIKPGQFIVVDKAAGKEPRPGWSKSSLFNSKGKGFGYWGPFGPGPGGFGGPGGKWGPMGHGSMGPGPMGPYGCNNMKGKWGYDPWYDYWYGCGPEKGAIGPGGPGNVFGGGGPGGKSDWGSEFGGPGGGKGGPFNGSNPNKGGSGPDFNGKGGPMGNMMNGPGPDFCGNMKGGGPNFGGGQNGNQCGSNNIGPGNGGGPGIYNNSNKGSQNSIGTNGSSNLDFMPNDRNGSGGPFDLNKGCMSSDNGPKWDNPKWNDNPKNASCMGNSRNSSDGPRWGPY